MATKIIQGINMVMNTAKDQSMKTFLRLEKQNPPKNTPGK
jgi:hypothetical protein